MMQSGENQIEFIPLTPGIRKRRAMLISNMIPGLILVLSSFSYPVDTVGLLLLRIFAMLSGILVVVFSIMGFKKPGSVQWMGTDMIMVFTGFLIIAQGASAYKPLKDFQPAHLLFLAGAIYIFKGVMFPEAKVKRGFTVTDSEIQFRKSMFKSPVVIPMFNVQSMSKQGAMLNFHMKDTSVIKIDLTGSDNQEEVFNELRKYLSYRKAATDSG